MEEFKLCIPFFLQLLKRSIRYILCKNKNNYSHILNRFIVLHVHKKKIRQSSLDKIELLQDLFSPLEWQCHEKKIRGNFYNNLSFNFKNSYSPICFFCIDLWLTMFILKYDPHLFTSARGWGIKCFHQHFLQSQVL